MSLVRLLKWQMAHSRPLFPGWKSWIKSKYMHSCLFSCLSFFLQLILWTHRCRLRPSALRVFVCACICRLKNQKDNAADVFNTEQHSKTPLQHPYNNSQQPLNSRSHVWLYFSFQLCNMTHWFFQPPQSVQHTKEDCCSLLFPLLLPRISSSRLFWTGVAVKGVILTLNGG